MGKEKLFELIRNEEVILFTGAGMSIYAGYPSGPSLAKLLYDGLTKEEQQDIDFTNDLPKLADDIYNIHGGKKNYLLRSLRKIFLEKPKSIETHILLSKIPQFRNIITTNYDSLFEDTNRELEVIRHSKDYPLIDTRKQLLFKIHGDFTCTDNIILTTSDYNQYFSYEKDQTVFWNAVKDKLASNAILFIGYSFDDTNIKVIIEKITSQLGENQKEIFFVAPSIKLAKKKFLERHGITYIESTGEKLIEDIYNDLKLNYFPELQKGIGNADTAFKFAHYNDIELDLRKTNNGYSIAKNGDENDYTENKFKISFQVPIDKADEIMDSLNGKTFGDLTFDGENINAFEHFFKGIRLKNEESLKQFMFIKLPNFQGKVDIIFDDGTEYENLYLEIFMVTPASNEKHFRIKILNFTVTYKLLFDKIQNSLKFNVIIDPDEIIDSLSLAIKFFDIFDKTISGHNFKIYQGNELIHENVDGKKIKISENKPNALKEYFHNLKTIEQYFKYPRFKSIKISEINEIAVRNILAFINQTWVTNKHNKSTATFEDEAKLKDFIEECKEGITFYHSTEEPITIDLHANSFNIGYCTQHVKDGYIANIKDLHDGVTKQAILKSRSGTEYLRFSENVDPPSLD
ncbi:SIR2 family protein [Elizabethkingia anophelis]|uniref:SIR2 family protein n=2 Tax=Elizabethkingia anophelis TaxID=1117645 RepID=UPI0021A8F64F|nr:SIR2 family protein [Elizabethkingia anophelis]MCT3951594.1 SIR2 family protein [Elizabethkingia anophelis]MCT3955070.1 SIR2 family protein [Elizabethkingia anophelis]MCT3988646.1 SIR2 family protein [Elizabethkingia anophelis]MCT4023665.1 SIR2 family protein [Elizabethkingia anophelis]